MVVIDKSLGPTLLQEGRWADARAAFETVLAQDETPEALAGMAIALLWHSEINESIQYNQRAYTAFRARGDEVSAAFAALTISIVYNCYLGNLAAAQGWLARAETAANAGDPAPIQGWLWSFRGYLAVESDIHLSEELQRRALAQARAIGDGDLELISLSALGAVLTKSGRVEQGLPLVDEAMAALSAGENTRLDTVVIVCCNMLMACEMGADLRRAKEWCAIADQFHERYGCPFLYSECRALYGRLLVSIGHWTEAERELGGARKVTRDVFPPVYYSATASLAELRTRQGRFEEAEALLSGLEHESLPAIALAELRIAQNQPDAAIRLLQRVLRHLDRQNASSVRATEMLVHASLLAGRPADASAALEGLDAATRDKSWPEAHARTCMAAGRVSLVAGDLDAARLYLEDAVAAFLHLGMPYDAAVARLALAGAVANHPELAASEAGGALDVFEHLGAQPGADAAAAFLRAHGRATRPGPRGLGLLTMREQEVLALLRSGLSNPEIADRLVISRKTAAHHVSSLLSKLGVRNRAEAVALASRQPVTSSP